MGSGKEKTRDGETTGAGDVNEGGDTEEDVEPDDGVSDCIGRRDKWSCSEVWNE